MSIERVIFELDDQPSLVCVQCWCVCSGGVCDSPVNAQVQLALVLQQRLKLLFGLSHGHALGKHRVHQELTRLGDRNNLGSDNY